MLTRILVSLTLVASSLALAKNDGFTVEVGERKRFPVENAAGVVLASARLAEVNLVGKNQIEVVGRAVGTTDLDVFSADAKRVQYSLTVKSSTAKKAAEPEASAFEDEWTASRFGGQRIDDARCELPFEKKKSARLFEQAKVLLQRDELPAAVRKLELVMKLEPDAATPHLFLGAALAKQSNGVKGAAALETFVLSCGDDPRAPAVMKVLKKYDARKGR